MAVAGKYSFSIQRGSTATRSFVAQSAVDGTPFNLTGYSVRMQIRTPEGATGISTNTTLVLDLPNGGAITISDAPNGVVTLTLSAATTISICPTNTRTRLAYGIELYRGTPEEVVPLLQGTLTVLPETVRE